MMKAFIYVVAYIHADCRHELAESIVAFDHTVVEATDEGAAYDAGHRWAAAHIDVGRYGHRVNDYAFVA